MWVFLSYYELTLVIFQSFKLVSHSTGRLLLETSKRAHKGLFGKMLYGIIIVREMKILPSLDKIFQ